MADEIEHADLFGDMLTRPLVWQPTLFKHFPHFDPHNQHTIIYHKQK